MKPSWSWLLPFLSASCVLSSDPPGVKIRITDRGLNMLKAETQRFVEQEISDIVMPEMMGKEGRFQYTITDIKIIALDLTSVDLAFIPSVGLLFQVQNSSITLSFHRRILYWFFYDTGLINASAEGVNIHTALTLIRDLDGRLKIGNITCDARISRMRAEFSGTLGKVYDFLASFLTTGMRFLLNQKLCPVLDHAALVHVNSMLDTIPVRSEVDSYIGIDYSLLSDPRVSQRSLDMDFRGMFFSLAHEQELLPNLAVEPLFQEYERMVYLGLSEYFFDSGMYSYYKAGVFNMDVSNERMPKDLEMLLRTTYLGAIVMMNAAYMDAPIALYLTVTAPPKTSIRTSGATVSVTANVRVMLLPAGKEPIQLSSMTMENKFNAKVSMKGKRLAVHADLRRYGFNTFNQQNQNCKNKIILKLYILYLL
ncbi:unnamed protein product [Knipowitschia caucasica]